MWVTLLSPLVSIVMKLLFNEVEKLWDKEVVKHKAKNAVQYSEVTYDKNELKKASATEQLKAELKKESIKASHKAVDIIIEKAVQRYIKN